MIKRICASCWFRVNGHPTLKLCMRTFQEHLRLKSSKYLRTFSLSSKGRRSDLIKSVAWPKSVKGNESRRAAGH